MILKEIKHNLYYGMYGETFYGRNTAQHQLQLSKIKVKRVAFGNKEHTKSRKSEFD